MNTLLKKLMIITSFLVAGIIPVLAGAASGQPHISLLGVNYIKTNEAVISLAFDSADAVYDNSTRPAITVVYTNTTTGQELVTYTIADSSVNPGSRTLQFILRDLNSGTNYTYKARMLFNGTMYETETSSFKTQSTKPLLEFQSSPTVIPTGYPNFSIFGIENVTETEARILLSFNSRDAQYSYNDRPELSITYINASTGETRTTPPTEVNIGSETKNFYLRDLAPNTTYWFKGVMLYAGQRYETVTQSFVTKAIKEYSVTVPQIDETKFQVPWLSGFTKVTETIKNPTTIKNNLEDIIKTGGYGNKDGVALSITNEYARITADQTFTYKMQYYNGKMKALQSARIVVDLPDGYVYDSGDGSTVYSNNDNTVTLYLGTVDKQESGTVTFKAKAVGEQQANVETKATLIYTGGSVSATDTDNYAGGGSQNVLGATVFGQGFFPQTFFGWLIIIVILVIIMIAARRYLNKPEK